MQIVLRKMQTDDAAAVNLLSKQLGYSLTVLQTEKQIRTILSRKDHALLVALSEMNIIGWIHAFQSHFIESTSFVEIGGIVVDENYRGKGVGKALVQQIIDWTLEQKYFKLRVRTQHKRLDAQQFYRTLKFEEMKEQKVFQLDLSVQENTILHDDQH